MIASPLDALQRELAAEALREAGAPFDPADRRGFERGVERVWAAYQALRARALPSPAQAPLARLQAELDALLFARDREEYLDDASLPPARRTRIIEGLDRFNRTFGGYHLLFRALEQHLSALPARPAGHAPELSLLDVGSGHGAFPVRLAARGTVAGWRLRVTGSDIEPAYVAAARARAQRARVAVEFRTLDALRLYELGERPDVITCTQTAHHFPPARLASLLVSARAAARLGVLVLDARRSALNLLGAVVGTLAVSADPLLAHDGFVSVRRMYSPAELEMLARCAHGGEAYRGRTLGLSYVVLEAFTAPPPAPCSPR